MHDPASIRVARLFLARSGRTFTADEGEGESGKKSGPPARWQEWLDKVHQGGKKKVPNPNAETKGRYSQVSFTTALRDKTFFGKAMEEYKEWAKKNPESKGGEKAPAKKEEEPKKDKPAPKKEEKPEPKEEKKEEPKKKSATSFEGALGPDEAEIDAVLKEHGEAIEKLKPAMQKAVKDYEKKLKEAIKSRPGMKSMLKEWQAKSEGEKMLHAAGPQIGEHFEKHVLTEKERAIHEDVMGDWQQSSAAPASQKLHGLAKSLGVKGSPSPNDEKDDDAKKYRKEGEKDKELAAYVKKSYTFTQAMLKKLGVKELTVYRGVSGMIDGSPPKEGDEIQIKTREMSSFTTDSGRASAFGRRIEYKIPAEQVFSSALTNPKFGPHGSHKDTLGEAEVVVLGASTNTGKVADKARS
jgi:hypothetical protein